MRNSRNFLGFLAAVAFMVLTAMASAQSSISDTSATASVDVQPALSLSLIASPSWGQVVRPTTGSAEYKLDYTTGAVTVVSGLGYAFDNGHFGEYTLSGAPSAPVAYTVSIGAFSGTGVSVIEADINGAAASGTGLLDGSGNMDIRVGGTLAIASTATVAIQTATVTVTVDYN